MSTETTSSTVRSRRYIIVAAMVATIFVASYAYASASRGGGAALQPAFDTTGAYGAADGGYADPNAAGGAGGACGCCGGSGETVEAEATLAGDVQTIDVDTSTGSFAPNVIKAKAGVPLTINFSQAPGGCLSGVLIPDFQVNELLTDGPKTIELPAMEPGEYAFSCDMQMIYGSIVVE